MKQISNQKFQLEKIRDKGHWFTIDLIYKQRKIVIQQDSKKDLDYLPLPISVLISIPDIHKQQIQALDLLEKTFLS